MSKFKQSLQSSGVLDVVREISASDLVCYTNFTDAAGLWSIIVTNGEIFWRAQLAERDVGNLSISIEQMRDSLESGDLKLHPQAGGKATLSLSSGSKSIDFNAFELPASEKKNEIKLFVLSMTKNVLKLRQDLKCCKEELAEVTKKTSRTTYDSLLPDVSTKGSGSKVQGRVKKPAGHSLINPSSKRRKAAVGVVFGDED